MSAAAVEHPCDPCDGEPPTLLEEANRLMELLPGHRVEIIGGILTVTPSPDSAHARALTKIMRPFMLAGLDGEGTEVLQGVGLWLPDGPEDYAIPDMAIVDADIDEHLIQNNYYDPAVFRLVVEVTSSNYRNDLRNKVTAYARAKIPVYVIVDRKHNRVHVLTEPLPDGYDSHEVYAPGQQVTLPDSIGAEVKLDVAEVLKAGQRRAPDKPVTD
ncbi:Uma2 family endonuclease [Streptomyces sp. PKU-EA00015]|uniref:Uma2 family endonuclease n=1 Tax=Streptomyces sp. PKU-EA00015 TaxID=2748326 RepID=UPI0015A16480|nr:Uma2 family endonuclease [Streptomyces sp. PKU-EA00015]NWF27872.1 Uma2 family endonuclease [Streptomyces sp. PKU-EA00015]